jgi:hypothetical protein
MKTAADIAACHDVLECPSGGLAHATLGQVQDLRGQFHCFNRRLLDRKVPVSISEFARFLNNYSKSPIPSATDYRVIDNKVQIATIY